MKKFFAETGGRYVYIDDILNLQDLALSILHIFDNCGDFVISGCDHGPVINLEPPYRAKINNGWVYIDNELRYYECDNVGYTFPCYIIPVNEEENVSYATGSTGKGREVYKAAISQTEPATGHYIKLGGELGEVRKTLNEAFFGKYGVLLNPDGEQTVNGGVNFADGIKEGGESLEEKYALAENLRQLTENFGGLSVYSREEADNKFAKKELLLSDVADTEAHKTAVRNTLGVYSKAEAEPKQYDSGLKDLMANEGHLQVTVQQVGKVVSILMYGHPMATGTTVFELPDGIDAPANFVSGVGVSSTGQLWGVRLENRTCKTIYGSASNQDVYISITYLV